MNTFWLIAFILATAWMLYTYLGYPCVLLLQKRWQQRRTPDAAPPAAGDEELPPVAVVIVARHAAHQIGPKLRSCLDSDYPADRIRVVLAIDGPDEDTARAAEALGDPRITVLRQSEHRGKAATLNDALAHCQEPIVVMSDARQRLAPDAIRRLVDALHREPAKAAVSGELRFEVPDGDFVGQGIDAYWRYEKWLRRTESEVASTIGMTGALYAMRRAAFRPIPAETILDDVLIPMQMVMDGHRAGFEQRAVAHDLPSSSMEQERRRKIRTLAGNFQLLQLQPQLASPFANPAFFGFFSHKLCRLLTPVALLVMLVASIVLAGQSAFFTLVLAAGLAIIAGALLARLCPGSRRWLPVRLSNTFVEMHLFIVLGFVEFLRNRDLHRWGAGSPSPAGSSGASSSPAADPALQPAGRHAPVTEPADDAPGVPTGEPLRVLYLVSLFPCWSETFIVREIRALQARGVDVRILSLKPASETMVQADAQALLDRVIYPPTSLAASLCPGLPQLLRRPLRSLGEVWTLVASLWKRPTELAKSLVTWWRTLTVTGLVRHFNPHHLHAHWATYPSTAARILAGRIERPWSFTSHAHDIFVHDHDLSGKLRQADFSVTISDYNRRQLSGRMPLALRERLAVVHCGILPDEIPFEPHGRDPLCIVAVGRLDPIKGFIHLVEACRLLRDRRIDFRCEIIGDGPLQGVLQQAIDQARLGGQLRLAGALPQPEVRRRLREAAIFVLPSVQLADGNADGIPVALMEAMASGAAVVSTRVSGIPELVEDGLSGLLAPPGQAGPLADAIARLLADGALRLRLADMARQVIVEDFDANREADKLLALMLRNRRARAGTAGAPGTAPAPHTLSGSPTRPSPPPVPRPMPLRVMIVTDEMEVGGSQRQIVQLATGLKALQIDCVVVYFLNPSFLVDELHAAGVETIRVDKRKPVDLRFLRQLRRTIHAWRPDVLHGFSFTAELWSTVAVRLLPCRQRPALVSSVRGTYEWYNGRQWCLKRWISRNSLAIVSNSQEGAAYAARQMDWPASLFNIVPNGVRLHQPAAAEVRLLRDKYLPHASGQPGQPELARDGATAASSSGSPAVSVPPPAIPEGAASSSAGHDRPAPAGSGGEADTGMLMLFVGRLVEHKNLPRLLDAFARLAPGRPALRLLLVGSGPLGASLMARIRQLGLSGQVLMLGERDDVPALMAAADIVVAPSLREGLSNVVLEAMALGRPVVATRVGGTPEAIDDGEHGLLVDPLDTDALATALARLIDDASLRRRLGEAARNKVLERYSPQAMVKAMLKEYQRVSQR